MNAEDTLKIRLMKPEDFDAVLGIDERVVKGSRREYYEAKFDRLVRSRDFLPVSLVAEDRDGRIAGFVMGELYMGEYGIFQEQATLDTIGVDPDCRHQGVGRRLVEEFVDHLKRLGVTKLNTLVAWNASELIHFFSANGFVPSRTVNLERSL